MVQEWEFEISALGKLLGIHTMDREEHTHQLKLKEEESMKALRNSRSFRVEVSSKAGRTN